jgi:small multidrug resistance pump
MPNHYLYLIAAVVAETIGTSSMQASQQFSKFWPSVLCVASFLVALFLMSQALKEIPVGILYATWSGLGIVFIAIIGWIVFGQKLDFAAIAGMTLIIAGIAVINLLSGTSTH